MPGRKRKGNKTNKSVEKKETKIFLEFFQELVDDACNEIMRSLEEKCEKVKEIYHRELLSIPIELRNMTLGEYLARQKEQEQEQYNDQKEKKNLFEISTPSAILKDLKMKSSKIKSQKKHSLRHNNKRRQSGYKKVSSAAVSSSNWNLKGSRQRIGPKKGMSYESVGKQFTRGSSAPVTPKFNPNAPLTPGLLRKPKVGEIIMSMSGSPLLNTVNIAPKSKCLILESGKVLNLDSIENEDMSNIDQVAKEHLRNIQVKLAKMLN